MRIITKRFGIAGAALILVAALTIGLGARPAAQAQDQAGSEVTLFTPWSLVAVTESGPVEEIFDGPNTEAVFAWDAAAEAFDSWRKALPGSLNSLQQVTAGQAVWVLATLQDRFLQAVLQQAIEVALLGGWKLVGWTGGDTPAATVAEVLGADILIAYDGPDQDFERYDVALPTAFNSLDMVAQGAGLWAFLSGPGTVTLPAPDGVEPEPEPEPELESGEFRVTTDDGVELVGDLLAGSSTWVLFAHQNGQDRGAWGDYPAIFNQAGFTTLTWDFRGFGDSGPGNVADIVTDWLRILSFARSNGAETVLGVAASMGGTSGMVAATQLVELEVAQGVRGLDALALISAPAVFFGIDALAAAPDVDIPALFIAGSEDGDAASDASAMLSAKAGDPLASGIEIFETPLHGNDLATSAFQDEIIAAINEFFAFVLG